MGNIAGLPTGFGVVPTDPRKPVEEPAPRFPGRYTFSYSVSAEATVNSEEELQAARDEMMNALEETGAAVRMGGYGKVG